MSDPVLPSQIVDHADKAKVEEIDHEDEVMPSESKPKPAVPNMLQKSMSIGSAAAKSGRNKLFNAVAKARETQIHNWSAVAKESKMQVEKSRMLVAEKALAVA